MGRQSLAARDLLCLILAITSSVSLALTPGRSNNKIVNAFCVSEQAGNVNMVFTADYNGDTVDKVMAVNGDTYTGTNGAVCTYTNINAGGTQIMISSTVSTSGTAVSGTNTCGARRSPGNSNEFTWTIELRELFSHGVYTDIDRRYIIQCRFQQGLSNVLSTSIKVYGEDTETDANLVKPVNTMSLLLGDASNNFSPIYPPQRVVNGAYIKIQIQTTVPVPYTAGLHHYGIHAFTCRWSNSPGFTSSQTATFIARNGCPNTGNRFGLTNGFRYASFAGGFYKIQTDAFVLTPFNTVAGSSRVYLECYVDYCYGTAFSDPKCANFCAYSSSQRRKRSVANSTNPNDFDRVAVTITIDPSTPDSEVDNDGSDKMSSAVVIAVSSSLAVIVLAIVVVGICMAIVAKRRRDTKNDDKHSYSSEKYLHSNSGVLPPKI